MRHGAYQCLLKLISLDELRIVSVFKHAMIETTGPVNLPEFLSKRVRNFGDIAVACPPAQLDRHSIRLTSFTINSLLSIDALRFRRMEYSS